MSNVADFGDWLDEVEPALKAWGDFVVAKLTELVELEISQEQFQCFFKVKPGYRVKDKQSALDKQKLKQYTDPKEQMTDLVGARFVVLLKLDLEVVEKALIEYPEWTRSKDRDPLREQKDRLSTSTISRFTTSFGLPMTWISTVFRSLLACRVKCRYEPCFNTPMQSLYMTSSTRAWVISLRQQIAWSRAAWRSWNLLMTCSCRLCGNWMR
jgi:hypothetical protein